MFVNVPDVHDDCLSTSTGRSGHVTVKDDLQANNQWKLKCLSLFAVMIATVLHCSELQK